MPPRRIGRPRLALSLLLGGWLLVHVAELTPHLVHHLLDPDEERQCAYLAIADHTPAAIILTAPPPATLPPRERVAPLPVALGGDPPVPAAATRDPPPARLASA